MVAPAVVVHHVFDVATSTLSYVVYDPRSLDAAIIDPVLNYEHASGRTSLSSVDKLITYVKEQKLTVHMLLETHAHADHLSSAQVLKARFPNAPLAIGAEIKTVQKTFKPIFGLPRDFPTDGRQFDRLLHDGEELNAGTLRIRVMRTPGHTVACCCYLIGDAVFTGDALFMPDGGTGRCDFPGGDARQLYDSVARKIYALPDATRTFTCHDYQPNGRPLQFESTVGEHKRSNIHIKVSTTEEDYVAFRKQRDATLSAPALLFPSVQINIDGGRLPTPEANGVRYLKIPLDLPR